MFRMLQTSWLDKALNVPHQAAGIFKGMSATGELSMIFRQNLLLWITHPVKTWGERKAVYAGLGAIAKGAKGGGLTKDTMLGRFFDASGQWSETQLLEYMQKLREDKYFDDAQVHGLEFTNIGDFNIADEHFVANVFMAMADARKVWKLQKQPNAGSNALLMPVRLFGRTYEAIEVANTLFGDAARLAAYHMYAEHLDSLPISAFDRQKAKKYAAKAVNVFSGRGDINSVLGKGGAIAKLAGLSLFSARLLVSRPQSLYYLTTGFALAPKGMRAQMAKDGIAFYGFLTLLMILAGLRLDPWDKDFGKIKPRFGPQSIRDMNIDLIAGMDAPLQWLFGVSAGVVSQIGAMARGESSDAIEENLERLFNKYWFNIDAAKKSDNWLEGLRYWRGKASPAVSLGFDYFSGKDFIGKPFSWKNALTSRLIPITYTQTYNALYYDRFANVMKEPSVATGERDIMNGLLTIIGSGLGAGLTQYPNEDRSRAEQLAWEMYDPYTDDGLTPEQKTAEIERKRIEGGLRNLYRMQKETAERGASTKDIDEAIAKFTSKYNVEPNLLKKLKGQAYEGKFSFVTQEFSTSQIDKLLKVATNAEREELTAIHDEKAKADTKRAAKKAEPPKPLAEKLNGADIVDFAKEYNKRVPKLTSDDRYTLMKLTEQRRADIKAGIREFSADAKKPIGNSGMTGEQIIEMRFKLLRKVLNSHERGTLTREAYDAAKAILGDEIRFKFTEPKKRERVVRGLDSLKGVE